MKFREIKNPQGTVEQQRVFSSWLNSDPPAPFDQLERIFKEDWPEVNFEQYVERSGYSYAMNKLTSGRPPDEFKGPDGVKKLNQFLQSKQPPGFGAEPQ